MGSWGPAMWAAAFGVLVTGLTLVSMALAAVRLKRGRAPFLAGSSSPAVTIVRPVCGLETYSEETLRSGFLLDHPDYEIVVCVESSADPVIPLVRRLMAEHPSVPSRLLVGEDRISGNPKLNNCVKGWEAARHDWVILADSNVLMPADYVAHLRAGWRANTGLVCSTPVGSRPSGFWAELECAFLNTLQARWQYAGEALGLGFAQGKSMLWYKPFLDERGGIRALGAEIAEDAAATKLVRRAGLRVHLVDNPFEQPLGPRRPGDVWARQLRWAWLRRVTFPLFFTPEILSGPMIPALCIGWGVHVAGGSPLLAVGGLLVVWYSAEAALARRMGWHLSWRMPAAFLLRDLLIPAMWTSAFLTRNVIWRGNSLKVSAKRDDELASGSSRA